MTEPDTDNKIVSYEEPSSIETTLQSIVHPDEPPDELSNDPKEDKKPRYQCAGHKRKDEDGKVICNYKARYFWSGRCPGEPSQMTGKARIEAITAAKAGKGCGGFYSCLPIGKKEGFGASQSFKSALSIRDFKEPPRISTGMAEVDKVLNGGLWPSTMLMFGGTRGTGKTSLLFRIAYEIAKAGHRIFLGSGEMTEQQNISYLKRIAGEDITSEVLARIGVFSDTDGINIKECVDRVMDWKAVVFFLDSLQHSQHPDSEANMGTAEQVNSVIEYMSSFGQKKNVASIAISHLTKSQDYVGSSKGQHAVDGLLMIDRYDVLDENNMLVEGTYTVDDSGEMHTIIRKLYWAEKSRIGPEDIVSLLQVDKAYRFGPLDDGVRMEMMKVNARRRR